MKGTGGNVRAAATVFRVDRAVKFAYFLFGYLAFGVAVFGLNHHPFGKT
jgi:hypothetical protein